jgi:hypothetical protein
MRAPQRKAWILEAPSRILKLRIAGSRAAKYEPGAKEREPDKCAERV